MKQINSYINEKLRINKNTKMVRYYPENKNNLRYYIGKILDKDGMNANLNIIDTSKITDMSSLFDGYNKIENIDISDWDVSNVTNMKEMFFYCKNFNCDLSRWDVSNVLNMDSMFYKCQKFKGEGLENWKINKDVSMASMLNGTDSLIKIPSWK